MEATQYQTLVGNDWLFKTNAILNWTTQELQISQNSQHMQTPAIDKANRTMNHVSLVKNNCSIKECGMTFLVEEECATLHANTRSSSVTE
ncbi:hypothetical protein G9A89_003850 [Geosiphon pyriformis]|nr:hypothetical protein G9A89_003850 [Geosiphon pyriformis]